MTILLPLGTGSNWQDNELRYCLRSIQKHLSGVDQIIIIGHKPKWLLPGENLIYVPYPETATTRNKERNIHRKILHAINAGFVSGDFLFMNDDHFLLQDFKAPEFPFHHKGPMKPTDLPPGNTYRKTMENTVDYMRKKQVPAPLNYDTHCPIIYNAEKYLKLMGGIEFPGFGYCIKSMYANRAGIVGEYYPDLKLGKPDTDLEIKTAIAGRMYFSISAKTTGDLLESVLAELYPEKSFWE